MLNVSIRNADFWLWEPSVLIRACASISSFYPQCGFLALGTSGLGLKLTLQEVSIRNADFWLWELRATARGCPSKTPVSIRNADFWLWEPTLSFPQRLSASSFYPQCGFLALGTEDLEEYIEETGEFLSAMRIFGFGNASLHIARLGGRGFLSAMRIFGFGNLKRSAPQPSAYAVSIRNADFWLWERIMRIM